jgi:hypothetical protein
MTEKTDKSDKPENTLISINKDVHEALRRRIGKKMMETGKRCTINDAISDLIRIAEKHGV